MEDVFLRKRANLIRQRGAKIVKLNFHPQVEVFTSVNKICISPGTYLEGQKKPRTLLSHGNTT
jgi:hypothetical protein